MYNKELITAAYLMNAQECDSQVIIIIKRENPAHRRVTLSGNSNARFYCCALAQKSFRAAKFGKYLTTWEGLSSLGTAGEGETPQLTWQVASGF